MKRALCLVAALVAPLPTAAAEVTMAVARSIPPYVIVDEWRGLEYDIVREALAAEGHTLIPKFVSFARTIKDLDGGQVDAAMTVRPDSGIKAYYSDSHVTYHNVAITLAARGLTIDRPEDMAGHSVLAFQSAALYLGPAFQAMAEANPRYREEPRQMTQPAQLFLGRVDVVVADRAIFAWFAHDPEVRLRADIAQPIRVHPIFPATQYHVAFRDAALRDSFNHGLRTLRESGAYERIIERYSSYLKVEGGG